MKCLHHANHADHLISKQIVIGKESEPGSNIGYAVSIQSPCSQGDINDLICYVDSIAEIYKTIRNGTSATCHNLSD